MQDRNVFTELEKLRVSMTDFTLKTLIGKGYFGDVYLAVENVTKDVYAIKKLPKASYAQSREERNIMVASNSVWIPSLQYAFQVPFIFMSIEPTFGQLSIYSGSTSSIFGHGIFAWGRSIESDD